jgi:transcriptional antiterminator RfaH
MSVHWYVLRSKPRKEETLWRQASIRGVDVFYPRIKVQPVNPRSRKLRPYFPGYMFVKVDLEEAGLSVFNYMPYAVGLVCFGGEPASISEAFIFALRRRLREITEAGGELLGGLRRGDPVWIQDGPFAGYEALFDVRLPGTDRVRVLLKMLSNRYVPVELEAAGIAKANGSRSHVGLQYAV